jgi:hypothetical protein
MTGQQPHLAPPNRSTGPKRRFHSSAETPEGKRRCRLNAYRQGLTGQFCVFTPEEQHVREALQSHPRSPRPRRLLGARCRSIHRRRPPSLSASTCTPPITPATPRSIPLSPKPEPGARTPTNSITSRFTRSASSGPLADRTPGYLKNTKRTQIVADKIG